MSGSFDVELSRIFNEYDKVNAGTSDQSSASELFRQKFRDTRRSTLLPALETIATSLATRGVRTKLLTERELPESGSEPFVTLLLQVDMTKSDSSFDRANFTRQHPDSKYPYLPIQSDGDHQRVVITRSTSAPGHAGARHEDGSTPLNDVSESLLQQQVLGILKEIYATTRK